MGSRPEVSVAKTPAKVHEYFGVTSYGPTEPIFCDRRGLLGEQGPLNPCKVCELKSTVKVLPLLLEGGNKIFSNYRLAAASWIFQQNNAYACTAKAY